MKYFHQKFLKFTYMSHPVRGAWIEIRTHHKKRQPTIVAPREGCVD